MLETRNDEVAKTELAREYFEADTVDKLLKKAAKTLCLSVAHVYFTLNPKDPLNIVLAIQKLLMPKRYWAECKRTNVLFAECLFFVLDKFREFCLSNELGIYEGQYDQLIIDATHDWARTNRFPEKERKMIQEQVVDIYEARISRNDDSSDDLKRLMNATGKKPTSESLVTCVNFLSEMDPIMLMEPLVFLARYRQLENEQ